MPVCLYLRVFGVRVCADADHEVYSLPIPVSQLEIRLFQFPRGGQAWMLEIRGACRPSLQVLPEVIEIRCSTERQPVRSLLSQTRVGGNG